MLGLFIIAIIAIGILFPPAIILTVIHCKHWEGYFGDCARATDKWACVVFQFLLNAILIKSTAIHKFGNLDDFISQVLADSYRLNTTTKLGFKVCKFLIKKNDPCFK